MVYQCTLIVKCYWGFFTRLTPPLCCSSSRLASRLRADPGPPGRRRVPVLLQPRGEHLLPSGQLRPEPKPHVLLGVHGDMREGPTWHSQAPARSAVLPPGCLLTRNTCLNALVPVVSSLFPSKHESMGCSQKPFALASFGIAYERSSRV